MRNLFDASRGHERTPLLYRATMMTAGPGRVKVVLVEANPPNRVPPRRCTTTLINMARDWVASTSPDGRPEDFVYLERDERGVEAVSYRPLRGLLLVERHRGPARAEVLRKYGIDINIGDRP